MLQTLRNTELYIEAICKLLKILFISKLYDGCSMILGWLLPYINMNQPQVCTCLYLLSLLPPSAWSHTSGWSQHTGFDLAASYGRFPLAIHSTGFTAGSAVKNPPAMQELQETWLWSLGQEDPLEEGMATHSSSPIWRFPWTEEPGRLQSMVSQGVGHNWSDLPDTSILHLVKYFFQWMDKEVLVHIYNGILFKPYKRTHFESVLMRWMNLELIIQCEVSHKEKNKHHILMHTYGI